VELLVELDRGGELSLGEQLAGGIREAIRAGRLPPDAALPRRAVWRPSWASRAAW
jgi:hypothetical protein